MKRRTLGVMLGAMLMGCGGDGAGDAMNDAIPDAMPDAMSDAMSDATLDTGSAETPDGAPRDAAGTEHDGHTDMAPELGDGSPDAAPAPCVEPLIARVDGESVEQAGFDPTAARGPSRTLLMELTNPCARRVRFLGHPDDWLSGAGFDLEQLPPILLEPGASTALGLRFVPDGPGEVRGQLVLPHDGPDAPLVVDLAVSVAPARRVVFTGDGRHVVATEDYGHSAPHDAFETLEAHGDALQRGVCWGAGRFVAVGGNDDRRWWTSDDGIEWQSHRADGAVMAGCAFGDGRFVAAAGAPLWSDDGLNWREGDAPAFDPNHLRAIGFGGGVFVAVGDNGRVATTTDGSQWHTDDVLDVGSLSAVAWGAGLHVAVGAAGGVVVSDDGGETWRLTVAAGAGDLAGVVWAEDRFVAGDGARIFSSADGMTWMAVNASPVVPLTAFGRQIFGVSGAALSRSEDGGFTWHEWHASAGGLGVDRAAVEGL